MHKADCRRGGAHTLPKPEPVRLVRWPTTNHYRLDMCRKPRLPQPDMVEIPTLSRLHGHSRLLSLPAAIFIYVDQKLLILLVARSITL